MNKARDPHGCSKSAHAWGDMAMRIRFLIAMERHADEDGECEEAGAFSCMREQMLGRSWVHHPMRTRGDEALLS